MVPEAVHKSSLEFIWSQYRSWAVTSQKLKKELTMWRAAAFILTIAGALAAILSQRVDEWPAVTQVLRWISAGAVGIAGYAGSKILNGEKEKSWLQARAAAENCKSNAYLYLLKVPPYNQKDDDAILFGKIEELIRLLSTTPQATITPEEEVKNIPPPSYSFTDYLNERIFRQGKHYYLPRAERYRKYLKWAGNLGIVLGIAGFLLGSTANADANAAVWIAFISTVSASMASFVASNRYQYLAMSYQATGNQLMVLWYKGSRIAQNDVDAQKDLVTNCEKILALENEAWMTELNSEGQGEPSNFPAEAAGEK